MTQSRVLIAGGGIGGLVTALTLHQIGVPCVVFESVRSLKPLGVGINLQPNAVRELADLGIDAAMLDQVGLPALEWALVGLNGNDVYSEVRGLEAGYRWPQYAVHRGQFHMLLYRLVVERLGQGAVQTGRRVTGYRHDAEGVTELGARIRGPRVARRAEPLCTRVAAAAAQLELGQRVRALLQRHGYPSVAAEGFQAPGVVVSYTSDAGLSTAKSFIALGLQTAAGVPLQCDEGADFKTFRIGLFGLEKLLNVDRTVAHLESALTQVAGDQRQAA